MKQQFIATLFLLFAVGSVLLGQGQVGTLNSSGNRGLSTSRSGATDYTITLLPGQQFTGYWYYWNNGTTPISGNFLTSTAPSWLTNVSPSSFSSSSCLDIVPIGFSFDAPNTPGIYTYTVVEGNGTWDDMSITLTVTDTPNADTAVVYSNTNTPLYDTINWNWNASSTSCDSNYYPDTSLSFDYTLSPNVPWMTIQPSSGTIDTSQILTVIKTFQSNTAGTFHTLQVINEQWQTYPFFKYYKYVVASPTQYGFMPNATWNITATQSYVDNSIVGYTDSYGTGTAKIIYANSNTSNQIVQPLVFVEPFEFPSEEFELADLMNELNTNSLSLELNLENYDLIFLEFDKNRDFIQRNAFVLKELLNDINNISGVDSITVVGLSMGGVIAKYALSEMENNNQAHRVRLLATLDSPHRGANVPLGLQYILEELKSFEIPLNNNNLTLLDVLQHPNLNISFNGSNALDFINLPQSPAAQQLLIEQAQDIPSNFLNTTFYHNSTTTSLYDVFQTEYQNLGYPQHCRNIALSKGAFCDSPQNPAFNGNIISFNHTIDLLNVIGLNSIDITEFLQLFGLNSNTNLTSFDIITEFSVNQTPEGVIGDICKLEVKIRPDTDNFWADLAIAGAVIYGNYNSTVYKIFNPIDFKVKAKNDLTLYNLSGGHLIPDLGVSDFAFVPTFSALDVHSDSLANHSTPFDNYRKSTQTTNGDHIVLDSDESDWLLDELKQTPTYQLHCQPNLPDLNFKTPSISTTLIDTNSVFSVNAILENIGSSSLWNQSSIVHFYLSKDDKKDNTNLLLNSKVVNFSGLVWFYLNYMPVQETLQLPDSTSSGDWFILILADEANSILEGNEYNNIEPISITVNGINPPESNSIPADWAFEPNDSSHAIIIPNDIFVGVRGTQPQEGDYIGAFYEHNGVTHSAGYVAWQPSGVSLTAYANDTLPAFKNGFDEGETFTFKIYRSSTNKVFSAKAAFSDISQDTTQTINQTHLFYQGGISALDSIYTIDTLSIPLQSNWSMIYSNIIPSDKAITSVCSDIKSNLILIKNAQGDVYTPDPLFGVNTIGNWSMPQGYPIKMYQADTLTFIGASILPELSPISLQQGWQIMPYYRNTSKDISLILNPIAANITLVKDITGKTYIPDYGINTIGNMAAGTGYKIKVKTNATLLYSENNSEMRAASPIPVQSITPEHFVVSSSTPENTTIVFPADRITYFMTIGDEIGVFNSQGLLSGSAVYNGQNFAVTVWGKSTNTSPYGFSMNEVFHFKIWKKQYQQEVQLFVNNYEVGHGFYTKDQLSIVQGMDADMVTSTTELLDGISQISCFPNPTQYYMTLRLTATQSSQMSISITDVQGKTQLVLPQKVLHTGLNDIPVDVSALASGVYFYKIMTQNGTYTERFVIVK
jgi:pimeloyl-ACP methyl ester carboxylesterase